MFKNSKFYTTFLIIFLFLFFYTVYDYYQYNEKRDKQAIQKGESKRNETKNILNGALDTIESVTLNLAEKLSKKHYSKSQIEELIRRTTIENEFCLGITAAFEPLYINDSSKQLYAPFYTRKYDKIEYIENSYDYTNDTISTAQWYTKVIQQKKGVWSDPYIGQVAQELVVDYGIPFYQTDRSGNNNIAGVISFTISTSHITNYLHDITLGKAGFAFIANKDLYLISHPSTELMTKPERSRELLKSQPIYKSLNERKEGYFTGYSIIAQEDAEFFFTELNNQWILAVVIPKHDLQEYTSKISRKLIHISIFLTLTLIAFIILFLKIWEGNTRNLWLFSFSIGTLLFLNIVFLWYLNKSDEFYNDKAEQTKILSITTVDNYLNTRNKKLKQIDSSLELVEIPTGVFLYDIDFKNAYDVAIIGKIWQKIPDNFELKNETTFVFPQASATGISVRTRPMSKEHIDDYWLYSYDFNATIQFDFNYLKYPLNYKKLDLQITYPHIDDNVVLTPDIQSYEFVDPSLNPGVSSDIYMPNSKVLESYFSFHEHNFYTNLGNNYYKGLKETAVLTFNVLIKNVIISSIISNIIPAFIIAVMLFLLPFTIDKRDGEIKEGGALNIIQAAGGFFFVLLLAHIQLRNDIETPGLIYLETLYFVMYFMLAIMSTAVLLFLKTNDYKILEYKHNLIFKLSYWPILFLSIYIISLYIFY
ncbi:MAG: hypothetical protein ABFR32_05265 [Bacteroidota bacterium]